LAGRPFAISDAAAQGVGRGRIRGGDLVAPFHGVRADPTQLGDLTGRCRAYATRMPEHEAFSHVTAAALYGFPLPRALREGPLHVSTLDGRASPARGVVSHELTIERRSLVVDGLRVIHPADCWAQLGTALVLDQLIMAGDFAITGSEPYSGRPPLSSRAELSAAVARARGTRGIRGVRLALAEVRYGALSPQETAMRLLLTRAGLPEPELNHRVEDRWGSLIALLDGAFPEAKVAYEYQGDHHRTDVTTYRNDMVRRERLADLGWDIVFVSADDLRFRPHETVARLRRRLVRHSVTATTLKWHP